MVLVSEYRNIKLMLTGLICAPIFGYLCAGGLKFILNCIRTRTVTVAHIGMGGMPSTHNSITATTASIVGFVHGFDTPAFSIALALVLIVLIDSLDLRNKVSKHARAINNINVFHACELAQLSEKLGHTKTEACAGLILGAVVGASLSYVSAILV